MKSNIIYKKTTGHYSNDDWNAKNRKLKIMKASFNSNPKIFSGIDSEYFIALFFITTIAISATYFFKTKEKNKIDWK